MSRIRHHTLEDLEDFNAYGGLVQSVIIIGEGLPPKPKVTRKLYPKSVPCFHCSKSLQQSSKRDGQTGKKPYIGFTMMVDGLERVFHSQCAEEYQREDYYYQG